MAWHGLLCPEGTVQGGGAARTASRPSSKVATARRATCSAVAEHVSSPLDPTHATTELHFQFRGWGRGATAAGGCGDRLVEKLTVMLEVVGVEVVVAVGSGIWLWR